MTPHDLSELDDDRFFAYLAALDRQPDAPAPVLTEAWTELHSRQARIEAAMNEEATACGMTTAQVDELKRCVRRVLGVKTEDEL